jgi:LVIVD repeat-containing protein
MPTWSKSVAEARRQARSALTVGVCLAALLVCTAISASAQIPCLGPGAPTTTETKCLTAISIPGIPLRSFDISWVDPERGLYFLADRSNKGVDIISTKTNKFIGRAGDSTGPGSFAGVLPGPPTVPVNNNISGPDGVVSRGKCLYAGDGDSSLKVFDISDPTSPVFVKRIPTGGTTRLDEMALTSDGKFLLAANNAEDPPFATLFTVYPNSDCDSISSGVRITVDPSVIPAGSGLSIEQPTWENSTQRFIVSVPTIAENPAGCDYVLQNKGSNPCSGAVLVIDPNNLENPITDDFVPLIHCGPNGATVGPRANVMVGCTPNNQKGDSETTIINAKTFKYVDVGNLTGSDEVWFDRGSGRYYTGSSAMLGGAVLGVVDGETNFLLETIPQSGASHSVAADRRRHKVFVPQVAPFGVVGIGGDKTPVGAGICGTTNGCIAVYTVPRGKDEEEGDDGDGR